jgi:amino acid efflux transporter
MSNVKLSREITLVNLVAYYFSTVVGAGIFVVPVLAARIAGPASILSWIIAILLAYPFAMIFAHISQRYKVSGTIQKFVEDATSIRFGESIALFLITSAMVGNFLLGYTSAGYVGDLLGISVENYRCLLAFVIISISCLFNLANIGLSSAIQTFCVFLLIGIVCVVVGTSVPSFNVEHMEPFTPFGYQSILAASVLCFYSVTGWENVVSMAEEVKDPSKTYKRAIKVALVLITFFYLSLVFSMILVMTPEQINDKVTIMSALLKISVGHEAGVLGSLIAIFLLFLGSNAWVMGTSRLIFALANNNVISKIFSKVNKSTHIPVGGILAQTLFYALLGLIMYLSGLQDESLAEVASLNYLLLYTIVFFCGLKSFTTLRLKSLAAFALVATTTFLIHSTNAHLQISVVLALICFLYVYIIRKKVHLPK